MKYIITFIVLITMASTSQSKLNTQITPLTGNSNQYHQYVWATYNYHTGNAKTSYEAFQNLFSTNPSPYAYTGYIPLLFALEQYKSIAHIIPYLDAFFQNHMETQLIFAQSLSFNGDSAAAHNKSIKLAEQFPHNPEIIYNAIQSYIGQNEFQAGLNILHAYLDHNSISYSHYLFYYLEGQIYTALQRLQSAKASLKKSITLNNKFEQSWLLLGLVYELQHKEDKALLIYQEYLENIGSSKRILQQKNTLRSQNKKRNFSLKQKPLNKHVKSLMHNTPSKLYANNCA